MQGQDPIRVCLGFPPLTAPHYLERLASIPGVIPVVLPIDEGGDWLSISPGEPHAEPPPLADQPARVYLGSSAGSGTAGAVVFATGMKTVAPISSTRCPGMPPVA